MNLNRNGHTSWTNVQKNSLGFGIKTIEKFEKPTKKIELSSHSSELPQELHEIHQFQTQMLNADFSNREFIDNFFKKLPSTSINEFIQATILRPKNTFKYIDFYKSLDLVYRQIIVKYKLSNDIFNHFLNPYLTYIPDKKDMKRNAYSIFIPKTKNKFDSHKQSEIIKALINDNQDYFIQLSANTQIDYSIQFDLFKLDLGQPNLIQMAAFCSAVSCFKYFSINNAKLDNIADFAIAGGNIEIIRICTQNNVNLLNKQGIALYYRHYEIFDWLVQEASGFNLTMHDYYVNQAQHSDVVILHAFSLMEKHLNAENFISSLIDDYYTQVIPLLLSHAQLISFYLKIQNKDILKTLLQSLDPHKVFEKLVNARSECINQYLACIEKSDFNISKISLQLMNYVNENLPEVYKILAEKPIENPAEMIYSQIINMKSIQTYSTANELKFDPFYSYEIIQIAIKEGNVSLCNAILSQKTLCTHLTKDQLFSIIEVPNISKTKCILLLLDLNSLNDEDCLKIIDFIIKDDIVDSKIDLKIPKFIFTNEILHKLSPIQILRFTHYIKPERPKDLTNYISLLKEKQYISNEEANSISSLIPKVPKSQITFSLGKYKPSSSDSLPETMQLCKFLSSIPNIIISNEQFIKTVEIPSILMNIGKFDFSSYISKKQLTDSDIQYLNEFLANHDYSQKKNPNEYMFRIYQDAFIKSLITRPDMRKNIDFNKVNTSLYESICKNIPLTEQEVKVFIPKYNHLLLKNNENRKYLTTLQIINCTKDYSRLGDYLYQRKLEEEDLRPLKKIIDKNPDFITRKLLTHKEIFPLIKVGLLISLIYEMPDEKTKIFDSVSKIILEYLISIKLSVNQQELLVHQIPNSDSDSWALVFSNIDSFSLESQVYASAISGFICFDNLPTDFKVDGLLCLIAAEKHNKDFLKAVVHNLKNHIRSSLFLTFIQWNDFDMVRYYIQNGTPTNLFNSEHKTPLQQSIKLNNIEIFQYLIENGAITSYFGTNTAFGYLLSLTPKDMNTFATILLNYIDVQDEMKYRDLISSLYEKGFSKDVIALAIEKGFLVKKESYDNFISKSTIQKSTTKAIIDNFTSNNSLEIANYMLNTIVGRKDQSYIDNLIQEVLNDNVSLNFNSIIALIIYSNNKELIELISKILENEQQIKNESQLSEKFPNSLFFRAFMNIGNLDFLQFLNNYYNININDVDSDYSLFSIASYCIKINNIEKFKFLLQNGLDVNRIRLPVIHPNQLIQDLLNNRGISDSEFYVIPQLVTQIIYMRNKILFNLIMEQNPSLQKISIISPYDVARSKRFELETLSQLIDEKEYEEPFLFPDSQSYQSQIKSILRNAK